MKLKYPDLIAFDLDGTLIDSAPDLAYAIDTMLESFCLEPVGERRVRSWIGNGASMLVKRALNPHPSQSDLYDEAYPLFLDIYQNNLNNFGQLYPGVEEGLRELKQNGFKQVCITNKHSSFTDPLIERLGLAQFFDYVVSGDTYKKIKPNPLPLLQTAERFGVTPSRSVMVGDSINDIEAGRAAGFQTVGVSYGYHNRETVEDLNPDVVINAITELPIHFI